MPLTALELERTLVPLTGLAAALLLPPAGARAVPAGVAAAALVVGAWNLVAGGNAPVGYANGLALLAVMGALLAGGAALELRDRRLALASVPVCALLLVVVGRSESRAAWLVLAGGAAAGLALRAPRPGPALASVVAAGVTLLFAAGALGSDERRAYWPVALGESARSAPLGSGAGTWGRVWLEHRDEAFAARDAHSLYLETLSELGPLGLALVLTALVPPLVAAVRARGVAFVPTAAAAYTAFVLHLAVDWDWELAGVALAGILVGASLLATVREGRLATLPRRGALAAVVLVGLAALATLAGNAATSRAAEDLRNGDPDRAATGARRATRLAPWAAEPWRLLGEAQRVRGDGRAAVHAFREGLKRDDGDVELWRALARAAGADELHRASERAAQLDPLGGP